MKFRCLACRPHPDAGADQCPELVTIGAGGSQYVLACPRCRSQFVFMEPGGSQSFDTEAEFQKAYPSPMPPAYCISCRQTESRRADAWARFAQEGLSVQWWQAIHGKTWGLTTEKWYHRDGDGCKISPGHVGLILSHYSLWMHALAAGYPEVLVFEDDVTFCPNFKAEFDRTRAALPADWEVLYLGTHIAELNGPRPVNDRIAKLESGVPFGTHAMLLRRSALPILLEMNQEARANIDIQIAQNALPSLRWFIAWPNLCRQLTADGLLAGCC